MQASSRKFRLFQRIIVQGIQNEEKGIYQSTSVFLVLSFHFKSALAETLHILQYVGGTSPKRRDASRALAALLFLFDGGCDGLAGFIVVAER